MSARLSVISPRVGWKRRVAWLLLVSLLLLLLGQPAANAARPATDAFVVTTIADMTAGSATRDGTIGGVEYPGFSTGINAGFGDVIGTTSQLHLNSDGAGALHVGLVKGPGVYNDAMVIYLDTDQGGTGFATTSGFTDTGDPCRRAISGFDGTNRSTLNFASGFTANYAICMDAGFAGLWQLSNGGAHTFVADLQRNTVTANHYEMNLTLANLGLAPTASFNYVATYLNPTNAFRSNEFHGVLAFAGGNPGYTPVSLAAGDWNTFQSVDVTLEVDYKPDSNAPAYRICNDAQPLDCALRSAITRANNDTTGSYTIIVPSGLYGLTLSGTGEDTNATGDLDITRSVTIMGENAETTTVDAGITGDRVFHIPSNAPTVTINNLRIRGGQLPSGGAQRGAGLSNVGGTVTVNNSIITGNVATGSAVGGGVANNLGTLTLNGTHISLNEAGNGGGAHNVAGTMTFNQSALTDNTATQSGGGVSNSTGGGILVITNSTISGNSAQINGGGVANVTGSTSVTIRNSTIANNTANSDALSTGDGGGVYDVTTATLTNVILATNQDLDGSAPDCFGTVTSNFGVILTATGCTLSGGSNLFVDPQLGPLQDNGGLTPTQALAATSPAVDSGDAATCAATPVNNLDQRGVLRPFDGDNNGSAVCDRGAVEYIVYAPNAALNQGDGPGGVGTRNGASALRLWTRPDQGVYSDVGCTTAGSTGQPVGCWADQSGYGNHTLQSTAARQPLLTVGPNGQRQLLLDGNDSLATTTTAVLGSGNSYTKVAVANDVASSLGGYVLATDTAGDHALYYNTGVPTVSHNNSDIVTGCCNVQNSNRILTARYDSAIFLAELFVDGSFNNSNGIAPTYSDGGTTELGARYGGTQGLLGNLMETIVFRLPLVTTDRILVDNYLSSKFNLDISASGNDRYDGDTPANGDFDLDVAGIGRTGGLSHFLSGAAGLWMQDRSFLVDNGDWLLFGHRTPTNALVTTDLPTTGDWATASDPARWERHWYMDVTDAAGSTGGRVDIVFDFSEGGFPTLTPGPASYYRLLRRAGTSGAFSDITATCVQAVSNTGDQVLFQGVDVTCLGSNFTIGTINNITSPLLVMLDSLGATSLPEGIRLAWETTLEVENLGFHVLRATEPMAEPTRLTASLIPSQAPGGGQGASYEWLDGSAEVGATYFYWLEALATDGTVTRYGPTSVTHSGATAVRLDAFTSHATPPSAPWLLLGSIALLGLALLRRHKPH